MHHRKNYLTLGFGFFALLFGAGNLLFPPVLGIHSGVYWWLSTVGFILSDAFLAFLTLSLFSRYGSLQALFSKLGKYFISFYSPFVIIIFAFFIIPRTASMTYELSVQPFVSQEFNSWIFYVVYFVFALIFTLKENKVFDTLGRYFAPILALTIIAFVVQGMINIPTNYTPIKNIPSTFGYGFVSGYQTGDLLGALFQSSFAVAILHSKGYSKIEERGSILLKAGLVCLIMFVVLYFGLAYLGAKIGTSVSLDITPVQTLLYIAHTTMGQTGSVILAFVVFITCFTTTIGVLGMIANFMSDHLVRKVNYPTWVIILAIIAIFVAHKGVDFILQIAAPLLLCVYPVLICLVILQLFKIQKHQIIKITCYTALIFSFIDALASFNIVWAKTVLHLIPLGEVGFVWFLPTIIAFIVGTLIPFSTEINSNKNLAKQSI